MRRLRAVAPKGANVGVVEHPSNWGQEPILNPSFKPLDLTDLAVAEQYIKMADTLQTSLSELPNGWNAYASYVDGYGGYPELVRLREASGAFLLSITVVSPGHSARCADVEGGGMSAAELPYWLDHVALKDGSPPWVYTSAGNMHTCNEYIGSRTVVRWSAHYKGWHVCGPSTCGYPQADITQCFPYGLNHENYDRSLGFAHAIPHAGTNQGVANAALSFHLASGRWQVRPTAGDVQFAAQDRWASAEVQINVHTGEWRVHPLEWDAPPLGA